MTPSANCYYLIRSSEGMRLKAYKCPAGVWTIGYGATKGVKAGQTITMTEAEALLHRDVAEAAKVVNEHALPCTQGEFDALTDFVFNLGAERFKSSTLLRMHQVGNYVGASQQFGRWIFGGGKPLPGLIKRRALEAAMYLGHSRDLDE